MSLYTNLNQGSQVNRTAHRGQKKKNCVTMSLCGKALNLNHTSRVWIEKSSDDDGLKGVLPVNHDGIVSSRPLPDSAPKKH